MFAFSQIEPNRTGQMTRWDIPVGKWLDTRFQEGLDFRAGEAISRMTEDAIADGPDISAELANKEWGIPGHLEFSGPVKVQEAALKNARKKRELELQGYLNSADHSWASWKGVSGFGAMLAGSVAHPLDFGMMFLPVVGSSAKARAAAQAGRGAIRQGIARGVVTEESLALLTQFPKFGASVIDGTIGNALAEIPVFIQKTRDQADYGPADAAINIVGGGVFAGALHFGFRGLQRVLDRLTPEIKERMVQHEVDAFLKSETPASHAIARVDENAIAARVEEDLRAEAATMFPEVQRPVTVGEEVTFGNNAGIVIADEVLPSGQRSTRIKVTDSPNKEAIGKEVAVDAAQLAPRSAEPEARTTSSQEIETRIADERERRIREFIDARKPERIATAKAAELQAQQAQGKILTQEQIQEFTLTQDEKSVAVLDEDAKNIEANLQSELDAKLADETLTPEQKEALQAELDEILAKVDEGLDDQAKAIEQAKNCLLQNG